jgi:hypothetical protein
MRSPYRGRRLRPVVRRALAGLSAVLVCAGLAVGLALILPLARSLAVTGNQASSGVAQVRIFENGRRVGGGTIVDPNWVLTAAHLFDRPDNPGAYSLRFGVTDASGDSSSDSNLRQIDRIEPAPQGDMAMVHFADAVPSGTWIPQLSNQLPDLLSEARLYGWGAGTTLNMGIGTVYNADAAQYAAAVRTSSNNFAYAFPAGINPIVTNLGTSSGDSGSGMFTSSGVLTGVHAVNGPYQRVNSTGALTGLRYRASFEEPVSSFRQWITDTINGAGSSGTPPNDELRRLLEETDTTDPELMSAPPSSGVCDDDQSSCTEPTETVGNLASGTTVTCASGGPACSYDGTDYRAGQTASISLSGQQVEAWCRTLGQASSQGPNSFAGTLVAEVSFTNSDPTDPTGYGWWQVDPGAVGTGSSTLDISTLTSC